MELIWLTPAAALGFVVLALPILIHLLTRHQRRRVLFPSLRFLRDTRLAALGRRTLADRLLLVVRLLILAAAVMALTGPVFLSAARQREWGRRVSRAFVVVPGSTGYEGVLQEERQATFATATFTPAVRVSDGLVDAAAWLSRQPPSALEVVVVGDLREGVLTERDLWTVPSAAGIRFLVLPGDETNPVADIPSLNGADRSLDGLPIAVRAAPAEQRYAEAALRAVLARGIPLDRARARRLLVVFEGATGDLQLQQPAGAMWMREALERLPDLGGGQSGDVLVVQAGQRAAGERVPRLIERAARAAFDEDLRNIETRRVSPAALAQWSRRPSPDSYDTLPVDEGDRRWFWAGVLVLLGVEMLLRRSRARDPEDAAEEEARVA